MSNLEQELDWIKSMAVRTAREREKARNERQNMVSERQNYLNSLPSIDRGLIEITEELRRLKSLDKLQDIETNTRDINLAAINIHNHQNNHFEKLEEQLSRILVETRHNREDLNDALQRFSNYFLLGVAVISLAIVFF